MSQTRRHATSQKNSKSILIIEDSEDVRNLFAKALSLEGYQVCLAANGQEAFQLIDRELTPDLILLDLSMPQMEGEEFTQRLRSNPKCTDVKVLLVSGNANLAEKVRELGVQGMLEKPVSLKDLYAEVRRQLK